MNDFVLVFSIVLNVVLGSIVHYENKLYNGEYNRAEYCIKRIREEEQETLKWRKCFIDYAKIKSNVDKGNHPL